MLNVYKVTELADAMGVTYTIIGLRPCEKIHESMWGAHEDYRRVGDLLVITNGESANGGSNWQTRLTIDELKQELSP
jgi:FlaA1/EpsC-like NDP-sugar epimerase